MSRASDLAFWDRTIPEPNTGCWLWMGSTVSDGYGNLSVGGRSEYAHRRAWILANGPVPPGLFVCHRCDNPPCVNPAHLFLGTPKANVADMRAKGRGIMGATHPSAKLNAEAVLEIRRLSAAGASQRELARRFGIYQPSVNAVLRCRAWAHVR